eukprot:2706840-Pyramimonas_sp.AAC.1
MEHGDARAHARVELELDYAHLLGHLIVHGLDEARRCAIPGRRRRELALESLQLPHLGDLLGQRLDCRRL